MMMVSGSGGNSNGMVTGCPRIGKKFLKREVKVKGVTWSW